MSQDVELTSGAYEQGSKGLKGGALGLLSSVVIGVSSTAPGYSIAATLGFVALVIHLVYRLFSTPPTVRRL